MYECGEDKWATRGWALELQPTQPNGNQEESTDFVHTMVLNVTCDFPLIRNLTLISDNNLY
jgi:hypothetical protein